MRMHRIVTGLISFALIGFVPYVSSSAATAASDAAPAASSRSATAAGTTVQRQLPARKISAKIVKKGPHKLIFKGKVAGSPKYAHKQVRVERRIGKHGHWKRYKSVKSGARGSWRAQVGAPRRGRWYFRATTPKTANYRKSHSDIWYTYSI